jgi:hypothetical protein
MEPRLGADKAICPTLEQEGTEDMTQTRARQHLAGMVTVLGAASLASMQTAPKKWVDRRSQNSRLEGRCR